MAFGSGSLGYVCFFKSERIDVYAESMFEAKQTAIKNFKTLKNVKKESHLVHCHLAEKDGKVVLQSTVIG